MPITITVPPGLVDPLRMQLLSLYHEEGESIHHAGEAYLREEGEQVLKDLLRHRGELLAIDGLLGQVGFKQGPPGGPVELEGDGSLLRAAAVALLHEVGEHFTDACERYGGQEEGPEAVARALELGEERLRFLRSIDERRAT